MWYMVPIFRILNAQILLAFHKSNEIKEDSRPHSHYSTSKDDSNSNSNSNSNNNRG